MKAAHSRQPHPRPTSSLLPPPPPHPQPPELAPSPPHNHPTGPLEIAGVDRARDRCSRDHPPLGVVDEQLV